jgi:hypothetical protein
MRGRRSGRRHFGFVVAVPAAVDGDAAFAEIVQGCLACAVVRRRSMSNGHFRSLVVEELLDDVLGTS